MGKKKRITYVFSKLKDPTWLFNWTFESRLKDEVEFSAVVLNPGPTPFEAHLRELGLPTTFIKCAGKADFPRATLALAAHLRKTRPDLVHAHLFEACVVGLTSARLAGLEKRLYTRHHATSNHFYHPRAVYYDRFINSMASDIIATSKNVSDTLISREGVSPGKIHLVHFGLKTEIFSDVPAEKVVAMKAKHGIPAGRPIIGVVSRYFELKGVQYVIPAFEQVLTRHPDACLVLVNTFGDKYAEKIKQQLSTLPKDSYREILFEAEIATLYKCFDMYVHVPIEATVEAFGLTYIESLAAGLPGVFTLSGVAPEFIRDKENALVVGFKSSSDIAGALLRYLDDREFAARIARQGQRDVLAKFNLETMIGGLARVYGVG